jgi:NADH-quinone oxidoreductase subunit L
VAFIRHAAAAPALWLALAGIAVAWYLYIRRPELPGRIAARFDRLYRLLVNKYYFDWFYENVVAAGMRGFGTGLWKRGDETAIDGWLVNGTARAVGALAAVVRHVQSGYLYHYAFAMIIGLSLLLGWLLLRP